MKNILPENSPLVAFARTGEAEALVRAMLVEKLDFTTFDFKNAYVDSNLPLIGLAAGDGSFRAAEILIDAGACRDTALLYAREKDRVITLLKAGANPNHVGADGTTPLIARCASLAGTMTAQEATGPIEALLKAGADVHAVDVNGYQAIHHAVRNPGDVRGFDRMIIVKMLVERGADLRATTTDGTSVMDLAVRSVSVGVVDHLLEHGIDMRDALSGLTNTAEDVRRLLDAGSIKKKTTFLQRLVQIVGADLLNTIENDEVFPVWTAAVAKHTTNDGDKISGVVSALADAGADLTMRTFDMNGSVRMRFHWYLEKRPVLQERVALLEAMAAAPKSAQPRARERL